MIKTILLLDAAKVLHYKDVRSVEKWCRTKNIKIFQHQGRKVKFIIQKEFEYAYEQELVKYLVKKYQINTLKIINFLSNNDYSYQCNIPVMKGKTLMNHHEWKGKIAEKGEHEKSFLSRLSKKIHEL